MDPGGQGAGFGGAVIPQFTLTLSWFESLGFLVWCISTVAWCSGLVKDGVIMRDTLDRKPACLPIYLLFLTFVCLSVSASW